MKKNILKVLLFLVLGNVGFGDAAQILGDYYSIDKGKVYYGSKILEGANPKTAELIGFSLLKDDKNVYYMSENYTLKEALLAFIRTSCYFFIVVDDHGKVTGLMSFHKLIEMIVGNLPETDFDQDQDLMSVVKYARTLQGSK